MLVEWFVNLAFLLLEICFTSAILEQKFLHEIPPMLTKHGGIVVL
ncbi:hypothetical protein [Campylobacter sputorum]|nr:hypothetical protein [Campylobacter sputorum]